MTDLELIVRTRSSTRISRPDRLSRSTIPPSEAGTPIPGCAGRWHPQVSPRPGGVGTPFPPRSWAFDYYDFRNTMSQTTGKAGQMKSKRLGRTQDPTILVLTSLSGGPKHGYAVIKDIEAMSGVVLRPGHSLRCARPPGGRGARRVDA